MAAIKLTGAPTDANSSHLRGPAEAPEAIRRVLHSGMSNLTAENGVDIGSESILIDAGDLPLTESSSDFDIIREAARDAFRAGPSIMLGGDHSVTWPIIEGYCEAKTDLPHIIHIDAHPDLYDDFEGNPMSHASPMARLCERGRLASLTQIGIRTINAEQASQIERFGVSAFAPAALETALSKLPAGPTYFSIDIDGLDPAFAPGVSHHEPGGLTVREVLSVISAAPGPVIGGDIVEYNPARDINEMTAAVSVKLLKELAGRIAIDAGLAG